MTLKIEIDLSSVRTIGGERYPAVRVAMAIVDDGRGIVFGFDDHLWCAACAASVGRSSREAFDRLAASAHPTTDDQRLDLAALVVGMELDTLQRWGVLGPNEAGRWHVMLDLPDHDGQAPVSSGADAPN